MKKLILGLMLALSGLILVHPTVASAYNYGDYRSVTLTSKAWAALAEDDIEAVLAYTNKTVELYGEQARQMESGLSAFPTGTNDEIFAFWALNDVATSLYIQGEAYRKANMNDEAKEVYKKVISDYTYGQSWDVGGWFWKPSEAAKEKLVMLETGSNIDFGDYSSSFLAQKAWASLADNDIDAVLTYVNKILDLYGDEAKKMQSSLEEYPWKSKEEIFAFWALNDVGTGLFILGEAYQNNSKKEESAATFRKLIDEYYYAQCWDPKGWFWKPAEAAQQKLIDLDA